MSASTISTTVIEKVDHWLGKLASEKGKVPASLAREIRDDLMALLKGTEAHGIAYNVLKGADERNLYESDELRDMLLDIRLSA